VSREIIADTEDSPPSEPAERPLDLHLLDDRYEIVGELRGGATTRYFFGHRRADGRDVLVAVVAGDAVGENNALGHLASDAQLLESNGHPSVARVLDGRWLAAGTYAVVTERVAGQTLHELVSAEGAFANPRIAFLLQDVNSALEWARRIGVVHRGVTAESVYIDPDSRRPRIVLSVTPIGIEGLPDATSDARTIGRLAWSMLAGRAHTADAPSLAELAPNLSSRVLNETTAMANLADGDPAPDVERFLSVVAMGDALREGELEMARLEAELLEQRRIEAAENEAKMRAIEERSMLLERQLADDRAAFEAKRQEEEARLTSVRQQLAAEHAQLEQERSEFSDRVAEFELRATIEQPSDLATIVPPLASERDEDELIGAGWRFGWLIPVATVALLVAMIVFGSVFAHHRGPSQTVIFGARTSPAIGASQAIIPRGGFLTQSPGSIGARITPRAAADSLSPDSIARRASVARRDSTTRRDSITRRDSSSRRDSLARRDSAMRRDTLVPPDTGRD